MIPAFVSARRPSAVRTMGEGALQEFSITITPRMYETDAMGHINNASIAAWFEVLRVRFMEERLENGPSFVFDPSAGVGWILASAHIDYRGETFYGSDVTGRIQEVEIGNSSIKFVGEMEQDGRTTMSGYAVLVFIDLETRRPVRVPDEVRSALLGD